MSDTSSLQSVIAHVIAAINVFLNCLAFCPLSLSRGHEFVGTRTTPETPSRNVAYNYRFLTEQLPNDE